MDFRVSVCPTLFGEKIVLRLLDKSNLQLDMTKLGFEEKQLEGLPRGHRPALRHGAGHRARPARARPPRSTPRSPELNKVAGNITTAEDPVEFNFSGINQVQMHDEIGLNFATALRTFLRQDPDIIMVGEIRDFETAEIAVKAALTGHLVLSTLHTNDAPGTITRLLNMGVEPFLVTASVNAVLAQRLCRRVCPDCKEPAPMDEQALLDAGFPPDQIGTFQAFDKGRAAKLCNDTGYKGRVALYEVMPMWDDLKELVLNGASTAELKQEAIRLGHADPAHERAQQGQGRHHHPGRGGRATPRPTASRRETDGQPAPAAQGDDREGGERPAHHHRLAAAAPHRRQAGPAQEPARSRPWRPSSSATRSSPTRRSTSSRRRTSSTSPSA